MLALVLAFGLAAFALAFRFYSRRVARLYRLDGSAPTPAVTLNDGRDYVPTGRWYLLAQHFSAISAAGPIFGPIIAGLAFGWLPSLAWIVFGCVFIGAVHDFSTLIGSVKHRAMSVTEIAREYSGRGAYLVFVAFMWLCLVYVLTAFSDVTARAFLNDVPITNSTGGELGRVRGGGVAASSLLYLATAVGLGLVFRATEQLRNPARRRLFERLAIGLGMALVGVCIVAGQKFPVTVPPVAEWLGWSGAPEAWRQPVSGWLFLILAYCGIASVLPVWLLLQPRGFLGGTFLYAILIAGLSGAVFGSLSGDLAVTAPAFTGFFNPKLGPLFPVLFITIACGACSGFHGIVCSGTTSKQLSSECDAPLVGYGGMLLEGVIALVALATVMVSAGPAGTPPDTVFARGIGRFLAVLGVGEGFATSFAVLAFATFVFDTIDVATRLGRYLLQELTGRKGWAGAVVATLATLALPALLLSVTVTGADGRPMPSYLAVWPVFGASNQLLAALSLTGLYAWVRRITANPWARLIVAAPMTFMTVVTLWSLGLHLFKWIAAGREGSRGITDPIGVVSAVLTVLAVTLLVLMLRKRREGGRSYPV